MAAQAIAFDWRVTEERVRESVRRLVEATHPLQIIAFGSRARGDHRVDSDLDLAVILDSAELEVSPFPAYRAIEGIHMSIDIIVASRAKFDLSRPMLNSVYNYIDKEGVVLYDRDHPDSASPHALHHSGEDQSVLSLPLPDRIFGFHAQQSCEKMFKALLAAHGQSFPFTHQLFELTAKLEFTCGETLPALPFLLADIQAYAVQLRYEDGLPLSETDRAKIRETVAILRVHILERILTAEQTPTP